MEATLLNLSTELLIAIADELHNERDLNALVRTCRRVYGILDRQLYRENIRWHDSSALRWAASCGRVATIEKCLVEGADLSLPRASRVGDKVSKS